MDTLLFPFQFGFMQNAFLILKGWALMGDAVSHAVLPGIVLAYIIGLPLIVGAFASGMLCAVAMGYLANNSRVKQDTVMGVVFSGMFALGIVLYVSIESDAHLDHILFGNMLGIGAQDLWTAGLISAGVGLLLITKWKDWLLHSFDPAQAQASGLWVNWLHYGLLAAMSLTIVATLSAAGLILAIGLLIAPGAIAFLLVRTFSAMLWVSVLVCMASMLIGTYASFFLDSAPAPTIILVLTAIFIAAFVRRQIITRRATAQI